VTRRPVSWTARVIVALWLGLGGAAHADTPPVAPAPSATGAPVEQIQETTVGTLSGVDVGVANMWEREYVDGAGAARKGLTARLDYEVGAETKRVVVGEGSVLELGGTRWQVLALTKPSGQNGTVTLRPLTP
jgi:hypothetical protein